MASHSDSNPSLSPHTQPRAASSKSDVEAHSHAEEDAILDIAEDNHAHH